MKLKKMPSDRLIAGGKRLFLGGGGDVCAAVATEVQISD